MTKKEFIEQVDEKFKDINDDAMLYTEDALGNVIPFSLCVLVQTRKEVSDISVIRIK